MVEKGIKKGSSMVAFAFCGIVLLLIGIRALGYDYLNWLTALGSIAGAMILFLEVGLKKFTQLSTLKSLDKIQYVSLLIGGITLIFGILSIPALNVTLPIITQIASVTIIITAFMIFLEIWM